MRVLHIASFRGNIGDQLNHEGFRTWFEFILGIPIEWSSIEIRETFRGDLNLEQKLREMRELFDVVVLGGGNFWELWPRASANGSSLDLSVELVREIRKHFFFNSLGVDDGQGLSENAKTNFEDYLTRLMSQENAFVSVRNDGASEAILSNFRMSALPTVIPDHGFFVFNHQDLKPGVREDLVINLANDMPEIRFRKVSQESFLESLALSVSKLVGVEFSRIVLVPHIYRDFDVIEKFMRFLPDRIARESVEVSSLDTGSVFSSSKFSPYLGAKLVLGTRFHANVCALSLGVPLLPIVSYPQIEKTFSKLPFPWPFPIFKLGGEESISTTLDRVVQIQPEKYKEYSARILERLEKSRSAAGLEISAWLSIETSKGGEDR
jgi:hypothetical protein